MSKPNHVGSFFNWMVVFQEQVRDGQRAPVMQPFPERFSQILSEIPLQSSTTTSILPRQLASGEMANGRKFAEAFSPVCRLQIEQGTHDNLLLGSFASLRSRTVSQQTRKIEGRNCAKTNTSFLKPLSPFKGGGSPALRPK